MTSTEMIEDMLERQKKYDAEVLRSIILQVFLDNN